MALEPDRSALGELEQLIHQTCVDGTVRRDALPQPMVSDAHLGVRGHRDLPQLHVSAEDDPRRGDVVCQVVLRRVDGDAVAITRCSMTLRSNRIAEATFRKRPDGDDEERPILPLGLLEDETSTR